MINQLNACGAGRTPKPVFVGFQNFLNPINFIEHFFQIHSRLAHINYLW